MGDKATLSKARMELEDMYQGIPDESVNLTFQDFAELKLHQVTSEKKKKPTPLLLNPISQLKSTAQASSPSHLTKLPSLDFNRALQASRDNHHHNRHHNNENNVPVGPYDIGSNNDYNHQHIDHHMNSHHGHQREVNHDMQHGHGGHGQYMGGGDHHHNHQMHHGMHHGHDGHAVNNGHHMSLNSPGPTCNSGMKHGLETSLGAFDNDVSGVSGVSGVSMASMYQKERGGIRRPGIPHSNICTLCSTYIYIFRHRCLVCGRVYCRQCVIVGMGEMTEGRKCVECLGRRFSQRYIQRAGKFGCWSRYPSRVKQAELKWAEKGPRRSAGNGGYGRSSMTSPISKSPVTPMTPRTPNRGHASSPNSFVMNSSSYSPYSPSHRHHLPF